MLKSNDLDRDFGTFLCHLFLSILGHFGPFPSHFALVPARQVGFPGIIHPEFRQFSACFNGFPYVQFCFGENLKK